MPKEYNLFPYQEEGILKIGNALQKENSVLAVAPTGSGKAVILSAISKRFIEKNNSHVIIFVHKKELLEQTRKTLYEWYGIISQKIDAKTNVIDTNARVYVSMVETFDRRSKNETFLNKFSNIGLLIIDEAHLNSFTKIIVHFYTAKRIGFTATPISASKKYPLKDRYKTIVILADVETLIELNQENPNVGIVPCECFAPKNIDRSTIKMKGDDFDEDDMGNKFSKKEHIKNALDAYLKLGYGKRTLIFNSNIKHSIAVYEVFKEAGLNVRHFDSDKGGQYGGDEYREDCLRWLAENPDAILCNVGILTTGFDLKSIQFILINKSSTSIPLIIQIVGRGMRSYIFPDGTIKTHCTCADMGGNFESLKIDPNKKMNWEDYFYNPKKPRDGISPIKICPECGAMNSASARICLAKTDIPLLDIEGECGYIFPVIETIEDIVPKEMVRLFQDKINVRESIEYFKDQKEWNAFYNIIKGVCNLSAREFPNLELEKEQLEFIFDTCHQKTTEWFKLSGKKKYRDFKYDIRQKCADGLTKVGFNLDFEMVESLIKAQKREDAPLTHTNS